MPSKLWFSADTMLLDLSYLIGSSLASFEGLNQGRNKPKRVLPCKSVRGLPGRERTLTPASFSS